MANEGALFTTGATLVAAASFALAARATRPEASGRATNNISLFFAISAVYLLLSAVRQPFAYFGQYVEVLAAVDRALFFVLVVPAYASIVPLAHLTTRILGTERGWQRLIVGFYSVLTATAVLFVYIGGITGPRWSYWGTEWSIDSPVTVFIIIFAMTMTGLFSGGTIVVASRGMPAPDSTRLRTIGIVVLVYYTVFTFDALGLPGTFLVVERLVAAGAGWFAYRVYTPE